MRVANSTHLRVSWHHLFPGSCSEVDHVFVVAEEHKGSSAKFPVQFDKQEALVSLDPCLGFSIFLRLFFRGDKITHFDSEIVKYNAMSPTPNINTVYGGLLEEVGFLDNICLKDDGGGEIRIPDPPEAVRKCVLSTVLTKENQVGKANANQTQENLVGDGNIANQTEQSLFIMVELVHPLTSRETLILLPSVENIKKCTTTTTTTDGKGENKATLAISISGKVYSVLIIELN